MRARPAWQPAAATLADHGCDVAILEARDRIGGRVWTLHDPRVATPIELGAEFVHGTAEESDARSHTRRFVQGFAAADVERVSAHAVAQGGNPAEESERGRDASYTATTCCCMHWRSRCSTA